MYKPSIKRMRSYNAYAGYHKFRGDDGMEYGSFEVFFMSEPFRLECDAPGALEDDTCEPGWYWQAAFPGCIPDGAPLGPFTSSRAAWRDARDL